MKTFVTGATGFVGREVAAQLHAAGHPLIILARDTKSASVKEFVSLFGGQAHAGDILDPSSLDAAMAGADAVIHLVGIISEVGRNTFENVHARGTQNVLDAARKAGVKRFIHMSAFGTRPNAVSRYHITKWQGEEAVRRSGLAYTIFRPSLIYGSGDHFVNQFASIAQFSPILPVLGEGPFQPIRVNEVANCFVRALNEPRAVGRTFDLVGPQALSFSEILDEIQRTTHHKRIKLRLPWPVARCMAMTMEWIFPKLGKAAPLNRDQLIMLQEQNIGNPQPVEEVFGLKPISFRDGLDWFRSKPD